MTEVLWHGRGGQGAFTAARLLGAAYVAESDGYYALAFPSFGPERRGAPIRAFTKLSDTPVGDRSQIVKADYSIYLDDTLFTDTAFEELKEDGKIILNTRRKIDDKRIITLDGNAIAQEILHLPITNTIMLGAFAAVSGIVSSGAVEQAVRDNMPEKLQARNIAAVRRQSRRWPYETVSEGAHSPGVFRNSRYDIL